MSVMHTISSRLLRRIAPLTALALCLAALALSPAPARADGYTLHTLHLFSPTNCSGKNLDGGGPLASVTSDGQGHLYGAAAYGGTHADGTLFEYDLATQTFTTLVDFNGANGALPVTDLVPDGQGHLYGTTNNGGSSDDGILFEYDLASGTLTTLVTFNGANGANPDGVTLDGQGHLYGATSAGGAFGDGTVFKVNLVTHTLTTLVTFNGTNGSVPNATPTLDGQGHLYGTTYYGGGFNDGTLFKVNLATHFLTTLARFNYANGQYPASPVLLDGQGHLYGATSQGSAYGSGTLFKYNLATQHLTTIATFGDSFNAGSYPVGDLALDGQGHLFGATINGGAGGGYGSVFKVNLATHYLTTIASFNGNDGGFPFGGITLDSSGILYGTANGGSGNVDGTVFALSPNP